MAWVLFGFFPERGGEQEFDGMFVALNDGEKEFAFLFDLIKGGGYLVFELKELVLHGFGFGGEPAYGFFELFYFPEGGYVGGGVSADGYPVPACAVYFSGPVMVVVRCKFVHVFEDAVRHAEVYGG